MGSHSHMSDGQSASSGQFRDRYGTLSELGRPRSMSAIFDDPSVPPDFFRSYALGPWLLGYSRNNTGSSTVYRAWHRGLGRQAALKVVRMHRPGIRRVNDSIGVSTQDSAFGYLPIQKSLMRELSMMQAVSHPNIVQLYDAWQSPVALYLFMESGETDLDQYIPKAKGLPHNKVVSILGQVLCAISYLHSMGIVHRDIKPHNIILTAAGQVKLIDFGLAAVHQNGHLQAEVGTMHYMAPEVSSGDYNGYKADMWSIGVLLFKLLTGHSIKELPGMSHGNLIDEIRSGHWKDEIRKHGVQKVMLDILEKLLAPKPDERPDARHLVELEIFAASRRGVPLEFRVTTDWYEPREGIVHQLQAVFHDFGRDDVVWLLTDKTLNEAHMLHQNITKWWRDRMHRIPFEEHYEHDPRVNPIINTGRSTGIESWNRARQQGQHNTPRPHVRNNRMHRRDRLHEFQDVPRDRNSRALQDLPYGSGNRQPSSIPDPSNAFPAEEVERWRARSMKYSEFQRPDPESIGSLRDGSHRFRVKAVDDRVRVLAPPGELTKAVRLAKDGFDVLPNAQGGHARIQLKGQSALQKRAAYRARQQLHR